MTNNDLSKSDEPEVICPACQSKVNQIDFDTVGCPVCKFKQSKELKKAPSWDIEPIDSNDEKEEDGGKFWGQ